MEMHEALAAVGPPPVGVVVSAASTRIESDYPRSASAYGRAVARARSNGLLELRGDCKRGFHALYVGGWEKTGVALLDVLV